MGCGASKNRYAEDQSRSELQSHTGSRHLSDDGKGNVQTTVASLGASNVETIREREREMGRGTKDELTSPASFGESPPASMDGDRSFNLDDTDYEYDIKTAYFKLLEQAFETARTKGANAVRISGTPLQSIGPSVELTHTDLVRIRQWCDFDAPFEPIIALDAHASSNGRPPRDHNLQQNQDLLDNYYMQTCKKKAP
eukprot:TRINITY_DN20217_c0_g1_i1.p1 TRINITY_DN20217_c0_g1~~TRINITY_DN20217_c0_g1_i1.p1  ORF type:complete len:197 (+),score=28.13 TRINITY_DN20217_c0_g1_i1:163-753(+)